jgi:transposase InsO family protein
MYRHKTAANARRFLGDLERTRPIRIRTILTDYGKASTDRLFGLRWHALTRQNAFGTLCSTLGIEYRLTPPRPPQTNGMVERFNGRSEYVTMLDQAKSWGRC